MDSIDPALLARLRFVTHRRRRSGPTFGERRSTRRGAGLEFADYRDYSFGDDLRRVDWNLFARLDRPYVRLFEAEETLHVTLIVDGSASMAWQAEGFASRWRAVRELVAALGAIALLHGDALEGIFLQNAASPIRWGRKSGRPQLQPWGAWVAALRPGGDLAFGTALHALAARSTPAGLVVLLTDGYDVAGLAEGIPALASRGHEVILLQVLTPDERAPNLRGDVRLIDVETGSRREVTIDGPVLAAYQRALVDWQLEFRRLMAQHGGRYVLLDAAAPLKRLLLEDLRFAGLIR
ncbi:MAG: DUF58 domain-containing protein [Anaerolineae bacterium]|nr:DUF58 domain-containing protein [Anaerolineae bacterium]